MIEILQFILSVVIFVVIFILPEIGVIFTETSNKRWLGHWLITLFAINVMLPILHLIFAKWIVQLFIIFLGVFRLLKFRNEKCIGLFGKVDGLIQKVIGQIEMGKQKVREIMKTYGL